MQVDIHCDTCSRPLASVWPFVIRAGFAQITGYQPPGGVPGQIHARSVVVHTLGPQDSSGHPAGSVFVAVHCATCTYGGGEAYLSGHVPAPPPPGRWARLRRFFLTKC